MNHCEMDGVKTVKRIVHKPAMTRRSRSRTKKINGNLLNKHVEEKTAVKPFIIKQHSQSIGSLSPLQAQNTSLTETDKNHESQTLPSVARRLEVTMRVDLLHCFTTAIAFSLRIWSISSPSGVVFDELVIGKQISAYLKRDALLHTDPPLIPQLLAVLGYVTNFDAAFKFSEVGQDYSASMPYLQLRLLAVAAGTLFVHLVYLIMLEVGASRLAAFLAAFFLAIDSSMIVQSRIFAPDVFELTVAFGAILSALRVLHCWEALSTWLVQLAVTGALLGVTISIKFSGFWTHALILSMIFKRFWTTLADPGNSCANLVWRAVCISGSTLLLPACIYLASWAIHVELSRASELKPLAADSALKSSKWPNTYKNHMVSNK